MTDGEREGQGLDLGRIVAEEKPAKAARKRAEKVVNQEAEFFSRRAKRLHEDALEHDLESRRHDLTARKKYGPLLFLLVIVWLFLVLVTVWASALKIEMPTSWKDSWLCIYMPIVKGFTISDAVLIALVSGATVNVIGLLFAVVNYTFPGQKANTAKTSASVRRSKTKRM